MKPHTHTHTHTHMHVHTHCALGPIIPVSLTETEQFHGVGSVHIFICMSKLQPTYHNVNIFTYDLELFEIAIDYGTQIYFYFSSSVFNLLPQL